jgi:hypothetical protein
VFDCLVALANVKLLIAACQVPFAVTACGQKRTSRQVRAAGQNPGVPVPITGEVPMLIGVKGLRAEVHEVNGASARHSNRRNDGRRTAAHRGLRTVPQSPTKRTP